MNRAEIRSIVRATFGARRSPTTRIAVEQEYFAVDRATGAPVSPKRVRAVTSGRPYSPLVSFEPGGQVELSLPPSPDAAALTSSLVAITDAVRTDLATHGLTLVVAPTSSKHAERRYLHLPRYDAMERHFDSIGPAGRRMMRSTASTQVCLDWWPGRAGLEQWRVLLLAGPWLAAALCGGPDGRLSTWLGVDTTRTALDDRLVCGGDPVEAYVDFAVGATAFVPGATEHVTTLFPPVRPRPGYLEVRFPDARPALEVGHLAAGLAALVYDDERRGAALEALRGEERRLGELWRAAAAGELDPDRGRHLLGRSPRRSAAA